MAASPISGNTPSMYGISKEHICNFLLTNREGIWAAYCLFDGGCTAAETKMLYDAAAQDAYRQACEQVQEELEESLS